MPSGTTCRSDSPVTSPTAGWTRPSLPPGWSAPTGAKTRADLAGLFDDLPRLADEPTPPRARRHRLLPLLVVLVLVVLAAQSALSWFHVPWLLLVVVGLLVWHRLGRRHGDHHASIGSGR